MNEDLRITTPENAKAHIGKEVWVALSVTQIEKGILREVIIDTERYFFTVIRVEIPNMTYTHFSDVFLTREAAKEFIIAYWEKEIQRCKEKIAGLEADIHRSQVYIDQLKKQ